METYSVELERELIVRAMSLHQQGYLDKASDAYNEILRNNPGCFDALHLSALIAYQTHQFDIAEDLFVRAIMINSSFAPIHVNRGACLVEMKQFNSALQSYNHAICIEPNNMDAYYNRGIVLHAMDRPHEALASYKKTINIQPQNASAFNNHGNILNELQGYNEALGYFEKAIAINPFYFEAYYNSGSSLRHLLRFEDALSSYEKALFCHPDFVESLNFCGVSLHSLNRLDEAMSCYRQAIALRPAYAEAYYHQGLAFLDLNIPNHALSAFEKAVSINPEYTIAFYSRAAAQQKLGLFAESLMSLKLAICLQPDYLEAYFNMGNELRDLNDFAEARMAYSRVLLIEAALPQATKDFADWLLQLFEIELLSAAHQSTEELEESLIALEQHLDRCLDKLPLIEEFFAAHQSIMKRVLFNLIGFYIAYLQKNVTGLMKKYSSCIKHGLGIERADMIARVRGPGKIRLGIASGLLKSHNGTNWAYNWLARLPKDYDIFSYAFNSDSDELTLKFSELGTHRSLKFDKNNFESSIDIMRADDLDILMLPDVGMNISSRILSCHRIAPTQFTAWGHPITTGSANVDFFLSSDLMEPEDAQRHYSETLVRMPNLALFLTVPPQRVTRPETFIFRKDSVLFGCLQSLPKYLPKYDFILPRIAQEIPNSIFVFLEGKPVYATAILKERLVRAFAAEGLDAFKHVTFLPPLTPDGYIDLLSRMDVILDSIGWTGGNTSLQAIELGKPIVTIPGEFMRGRHTYGMFRMMGLTDHVATSLEDYIAKAVKLGSDDALRKRLGAEILECKKFLYEDHSFIDAFDNFLKAEFAKQMRAARYTKCSPG